jgi:hypothetical protein
MLGGGSGVERKHVWRVRTPFVPFVVALERGLEQPVLRLGLLGFPDEVAQRLNAWIAQQQPGWPTWMVCDPHTADAWMICGSSTEVLGRDALLIHHPPGSGQSLTLNRAEVDRPLAFALPLPEGFAAAEFFDAEDEASVRQRLQRFEAWLRPLRTQFALGAELVEKMRIYPRGTVHVLREDKLMAVIDMDRWQVGLHTPARPVDLDAAKWLPVGTRAGEMPPSFMRLSLHRVMWTFAVRTARDVLPPRYRERKIYLRRLPRVPARWLDEVHLRFMRELMLRPGTLDEMSQRMNLAMGELDRRVAALYYGGGLTTDPDSARRSETSARKALVALHFDKGSLETLAHSRDESANSELLALSSLTAESRHSPLRAMASEPLDAFRMQELYEERYTPRQ